MADNRIHPYYPKPPLSRSSSTTSSTFVIEIPDQKEIDKAQGRSLITLPLHQTYSKQDVIYKTPVPLPPDYPSQRASYCHGRKRRNACCCCSCCKACAWIFSILTIAIFLLGLIALILYLVLQPKSPNFSVIDVSVKTFSLSMQPVAASNANPSAAFYLNTDMAFTVQAENPNKKIGIYFDNLDTKLLYTGVEVAQGSIAAFYTGHEDTKLVDLQMKGSDVAMATSEEQALQGTLMSGGDLTLQVDTMAKVRIEVGSWKSGESKVQVNCGVSISNPGVGNARLLSKSCSYKLKSFHLF